MGIEALEISRRETGSRAGAQTIAGPQAIPGAIIVPVAIMVLPLHPASSRWNGNGRCLILVAQHFKQTVDNVLGQRRRSECRYGPPDLVGLLLQLHLPVTANRVAGFASMIAGKPHTAGIDDRELAKRPHSLDVSVPQENEIGINPGNLIVPLIHVKVLEQVALRRGVCHAELLSLPVEPMADRKRAEELPFSLI